MPRNKRYTPVGLVYHVLNRGVGRMTLLEEEADYRAFLRVVGETLQLSPMRICGYCVMPNHGRFLLWPEGDDDLSTFMQRLTNTHAQRSQRHRGHEGQGHVYQGRFKSLPVEEDDSYYQVLRYIERNALRAGLVERAEDWRWSSLSPWRSSEPDETWPLPRPLPTGASWLDHVHQPQSDGEVEAIRRAIHRSSPCGSPAWVDATARRFGQTSPFRLSKHWSHITEKSRSRDGGQPRMVLIPIGGHVSVPW